MKPIHKCFLVCLSVVISATAAGQFTNYTEKEITVTNNGWLLKGNLILVRSKTKTPVVLLLNKANGDRKVYASLAKKLAAKNISSLRIDLRGHGESINKGKFIPFDSLNNVKLDFENGYTDIIAAYQCLLSIREIDSTRIGMVGASYSGEDMMLASRKFKYARSYIALSPGSFSDESMGCIDSLKTTMVFIKSFDERSMQGFEKTVFSKTKNAQFLTVAGRVHATDILVSNPEINGFIVSWLQDHL